MSNFVVGEKYSRTFGGEATCIWKCNDDKYAFHFITNNGRDDIYFTDADGWSNDKWKQVQPRDKTEDFFK